MDLLIPSNWAIQLANKIHLTEVMQVREGKSAKFLYKMLEYELATDSGVRY